VLRRSTATLSPLVSPTPTLLAQLPGSPNDYGLPFSRTEVRFLVTLGHGHRNRLVPPASPASELYSPCESVRVSPSCPVLTADTLLAFAPLELHDSRASGPVPAQARRPEPSPSPEGSSSRPRGPCNPPSRVRLPQNNSSPGLTSSAASGLLQPARAVSSTTTTYSLDLGTPGEPDAPGLRSL